MVAGPLLVRYGIDHGIAKDELGGAEPSVVAYVLVAIVAYFVATACRSWCVRRIGEGFLRDLRVRVFDHLQSLSLASTTARRPACSSRA